jgi:hypothetical protein
MARVKGSAVKSSVGFVKEKLGEEGFQRVIAAMGDEGTTLEGPILPSEWYDFSLLLRFMSAAQPHITLPPGRTLAWEMGRFSADYGLKTIYRVFFKVADAAFIIRKAPQVLSSYYDSGKMSVLASDPGSAAIRLVDFDQPDPRFCDRLLGWMERTLELSGAKAIRMEHPKCVARGDDSCDYVGRWS